jgi:hypothetical protein
MTASILWYIEFIGSVSLPPEKILSPHHRLTQVASLASRHEQITVRAAFFFAVTPFAQSPVSQLFAKESQR